MKSPRKKSRIVLLAFALLVFFLAIWLLLKIPLGKGTSKEFNHFLSELFLDEAASNTINLHFTLSNPKSVGIDSYETTFGDFSKEARQNRILQLKELRTQLDDYAYSLMNEDEQLVYDVLTDYLDHQIRLSDYALYDEVLTPSGGTTAQLPILLAEYRFNTKQDVEDYLNLLCEIDIYYSQILEFEQEKAKAGLFMSDECCRKVIDGCEIFTKNATDNFLVTTFANRLDNLEDLSNEEIKDYCARNQEIIEKHVIPAYQNMISGLTQLMGCGRNNWGLCNYPNGTDYYENLVAYYTGCEDTPEELALQIEEKRAADLAICTELITKEPALLSDSESLSLDLGEESEMVSTLIAAMSADFPEPPNSKWEICHVDPALSDYLAPAFYITAPIDNYLFNRIFINNASAYDDLYLFTTLAHEGFPGHLYQTVQSYHYGMNPMHTLLNYPGYTEGWATYVEMQSYYYAGLDADMASLLQHNQAVTLSLYATSDIGIHYLGWEKKEMVDFWSGYGITDEAMIDAITDLILEEPGNYLKYYVGYMKFCQLRSACEKKQGDRFDAVKFHEEILRIGPAPFALLEKKMGIK